MLDKDAWWSFVHEARAKIKFQYVFEIEKNKATTTDCHKKYRSKWIRIWYNRKWKLLFIFLIKNQRHESLHNVQRI